MSLPTVGQDLKLGSPQLPTPKQLPTTGLPGITFGLAPTPFLKLFIFGPTGAGKTVFGATAPRPLFLDTENSTEALLDWPELSGNCKFARIAKWTEEGIEGLLKKLYNQNDPDWEDRETVIVDTADALQRINLEYVLAKIEGNKFLPMEHHYKQSGEMLRRFILDIRNLKKHVIVFSHSDETIVKETGQRYLRTGVTPKLGKTLREEFGLFGFMMATSDGAKEPFANVLQTRSNSMIDAKSRYRYLPPIIQNPKFSDLLNVINKEQEQ